MTLEAASSGFASTMATLVANSECRAVNDAEFETVCRLRYEAYKRENSLPEDAPKRFSDRYDLEPNTTTYGLYVEDTLAGSLRVHVIDRERPASPATSAFPDYVGSWIDAGYRLVDGTRFVVDFAASRQHPNVAYLVARIAWMAGQHYDPDWIITTCRREHQAFYRRVFGHEVICPPRPYPHLTKPQGLLKLDQRNRAPVVHRRYPFLMSTDIERRALFGPAQKGL